MPCVGYLHGESKYLLGGEISDMSIGFTFVEGIEVSRIYKFVCVSSAGKQSQPVIIYLVPLITLFPLCVCVHSAGQIKEHKETGLRRCS